jgi:hypothetical protein
MITKKKKVRYYLSPDIEGRILAGNCTVWLKTCPA